MEIKIDKEKTYLKWTDAFCSNRFGNKFIDSKNIGTCKNLNKTNHSIQTFKRETLHGSRIKFKYGK